MSAEVMIAGPAGDRDATLGLRLETRLDTASDRAVFLAVLVPALLVYFAAASWTDVRSPDPYTNMATAWSLAEHGTIYLDDHAELVEHRGHLAWIVESASGRPVSIYPPGTALHAAPLYLLWPGDVELRSGSERVPEYPTQVPVPPLGPGALVGATTSALAAAFIAVAARPHVSSRVAVLGAALFAFGTSAFSIAADDLWQHGPAMMWTAVGVLMASREKHSAYLASGVAFAIAILARPPTVAIALAVALTVAAVRRDIKPALMILAAPTVATIFHATYNLVVFGTPAGAYTEHFSTTLLSTDLHAYVSNVLGGLIDTRTGLLVWSPFLIIAAVGAVRMRSALPPALMGGAFGAIAYLLLSWKAEHFAGGGAFVGYRYPLEAVAAAAPALILGWVWIRGHWLALRAFAVLAGYSIVAFGSSQLSEVLRTLP